MDKSVDMKVNGIMVRAINIWEARCPRTVDR
jgi:hypothetical protein